MTIELAGELFRTGDIGLIGVAIVDGIGITGLLPEPELLGRDILMVKRSSSTVRGKSTHSNIKVRVQIKGSTL